MRDAAQAILMPKDSKNSVDSIDRIDGVGIEHGGRSETPGRTKRGSKQALAKKKAHEQRTCPGAGGIAQQVAQLLLILGIQLAQGDHHRETHVLWDASLVEQRRGVLHAAGTL